MKSVVFFVLLKTLVVCAEGINSTPFKLIRRPDVISNRFIIEVESTSSLESLNRRSRGFHVGLSTLITEQRLAILQQPLDAVYHQIKSRAVHFHVTKEFKMDGIFNGAALTVNVRMYLRL
jgi:hypothetical protein